MNEAEALKIAILQAGSALRPGGIPVFMFELSNALIRDGHEVYVITGREVPKTITAIREIFDVERLPRIIPLKKIQKEFWSPKLDMGTMNELILWLFQGSQLLETISPDMIIINGAVPIRSSAFKVAVCHDLELRNTRLHALLKLYDNVLYRGYDKVATTSTELAQAAPATLGINAKNITTIPVCIGVQKYHVSPQECREHAILHVGTWYDKNLYSTVKAFCILAKMDPTIKLYVVGDLSERPKRILSKVKEEFLRRIFCVGHISKTDLRDLYSRVKVTSVPSIYQVPVLSPTALESLASGTPVIGGSTAISCDLLVDKYNGFRVRPNDFNTLAERMSLLTGNKELWDKLSVNARSVAENFDASLVSKKYIELYRTWNGRSL